MSVFCVEVLGEPVKGGGVLLGGVRIVVLGEVCSGDDYWSAVEWCELGNGDVGLMLLWYGDGLYGVIGFLVYCDDESA